MELSLICRPSVLIPERFLRLNEQPKLNPSVETTYASLSRANISFAVLVT